MEKKNNLSKTSSILFDKNLAGHYNEYVQFKIIAEWGIFA